MNSVHNPHFFTFHSDPGHAWLEVPKSLAIEILGLRYLQISSFSYETDVALYLEEDCDAPLFLEACREKSYFYRFHEKDVNDSPIRQMNRFQPIFEFPLHATTGRWWCEVPRTLAKDILEDHFETLTICSHQEGPTLYLEQNFDFPKFQEMCFQKEIRFKFECLPRLETNVAGKVPFSP